MNAPLFVRSTTTYGVELIGPTRGDTHGQAQAGMGYAARDVTINWEQQHAVCPMGKRSNSWTPAIDRFKHEVMKITFTTKDCQVCPSSDQWTHSTPPRRTITLRRHAHHDARLAGRTREQTEQFKQDDTSRAGIEGTIAQSVRTGEVRRARSMGQAKMHVQHLRTATIMNIMRILQWLADEPKAKTRLSTFAKLYQVIT